MVMLAELVDVVIGVDTHKDTHTAAVVATANGATLAMVAFTTTPAGYAHVLNVARSHGATRAWAIEGTRTYGTGLVRALQAAGELVIEVDRPRRPPRRNGAKTDEIDALRCAREALANTTHAQPRSGADRDALALLLAARDGVVEASRRAQIQLQSLIITAPTELREPLRTGTARQRWNNCARLRHRSDEDFLTATTIDVLVATARRIHALEAEAATHEKAIQRIVTGWREDLLELVGVGPLVAARCANDVS